MDFTSDDRNAGLYSTRQGAIGEDRPSVEIRAPQTPPRLQKKRSNAGNRTRDNAQTPVNTVNRQRDSTLGTGQKARKGSLRNAVRKLFGRRSRDAEEDAVQITPPKHGYHRSEPYTSLAPQPEVAEETGQRSPYARRTYSSPIAPLELLPSVVVQRTRSPYAVEFPQSARLKPLNLGDPYTAPGSQLRRRKTLPSVLIAGPDADAVAAAIAPDDPTSASGPDDTEIGRAVSTLDADKRRSRSLSDLRRGPPEDVLPRKRSDEIRYWRESLQPVLRASGFTVKPREDSAAEATGGEKTPVPRNDDPFTTGAELAPNRSARRGPEAPGASFASPSAIGSQLSQDIEDRVAKLEAGLQSFRGELASLAADRNRRTVLIGGVPTPSLRRRASSGGRTASMLAETLQTDIGPSDYDYDYTATVRPSTSPVPPRTPPSRYVKPMVGRALSAHPSTEDDPFTSTPPVPQPAPSVSAAATVAMAVETERSAARQQPQQYTFRSLYEMLADERSARRRLEMQMRGLQEEIANLHYQVSSTSNLQSQRSSYYAGADPSAGSRRLHALLRDTEESPTTTTPPSQRQTLTGESRLNTRIVSRFSGSDSEAGAFADSTDLETPHEEYQTPMDQRSDTGFPFSNQVRPGASNDGDMF